MVCEVAVLVLGLACSTGEPKVAIVTAVQGGVTLKARNGARRQLKIIDLLVAGDELATEGDGLATLVILKDKHREQLKTNVSVTLSLAGCEPTDAIKRLDPLLPRSAVRFEDAPRLSGAGKGAGVALRDPRLPALPPRVTPLFGTTILSDRPSFTWPSREGVKEYVVRLVSGRLDTNPSRDKTVWKVATKQNRLDYPENQKPLTLGRVYCWFVLVRNAQGIEEPILESQFSVITRSEQEQLQKLQPHVNGTSRADLFESALYYQEHGVYEQALQVFEKLARLEPKEGLYQAALADYYERAGRRDDSDRALKRAEERGYKKPPR